jgi:hypothetical protein
VAASVMDMFCNLYLGKNHKIGGSSTAIEAMDKISANQNLWNFRNFLMFV